MKKRLLSALLALALVFVLLPTTALAGVAKGSDYDISINGTNYVFSDSETCYFKSSFTSTEPSSPYLKLTKSSDTITVTVSGYVTVSDINVHNNFSTQDKINLIITGNKGSTLNIECKDTYGAALETYQSGDITIKGGITVNANFSADNTDKYTDCYGIRASKNLIITGKGTTVNAVNADDAAAVKVDGNITVSDGAQLKATNKYSKKVTNYTGKAYAIECGGLSISGNNTKVTAKTSKGEKAISGTVSNGDKLTFKVPLAGSTLHQKPMDEALKYTHVEITQAPTDPYVFIAGKPAIMDQETPIPGGTGTYLYKKTTYNGSFLTLKGVNITGTKDGPARFIQFGKNGGYYTIQLEGENKISGFSSGIVAPEDPGVNDVTVVLSGSGSLDITANQYAIDMQVGKLKFENTGTIKLTTGYNYVKPLNALHVAGNVTIDKTKYDITGEKPVVKPTTEDIGSSPVLETILKGTSTDETLYFKSITITPAAAKPSTIRYDGTTLKQGEIITGENGGTATVDRENNTITLNNFNGTAALSFDATLADSTLVLEGTNTLSSIVTTQKGLTISGSGSGSLTVGSIRVPDNTRQAANLTINGGAHVTVNRPSSEDEPAVEVSGNLTVTGEGTQLSAECTAATNPAIEVGGNVTISGNPGTNAYTVKAYNKYDTPRGRDDNLRPSQMPSAIEISGDSLSISNSARVMAKTDSDGAAVWMSARKVISVVDASLIAQNSSHNFSTISFGDEDDMGNIYAKGQVNIVAENMLHSSSLAHRAIKAHIYNHYSTGDSNPYYINVVSEGVQSGGNVNVIPGHCTSTGGYKVTITRGDAYTTPQVAANYTIAGQTMHVGKYYKTDAKGNITDGTAQDYNIYCDSKNDFTLNNATISSTGTDVAINTNIRYETNVQHHIKLIGTNRINNTFKHAISAGSNSSTIIIEGVGNASDASLTINGNFLPIYSDGKVIINAEVVIVNTTDDNSFKGLISTSDGKGAFDLGSGYKCYASTSTTGTPLEEFNSANYSTYKYLRVTKENLAPTTPTTYTVTITAGDNMKHESGALTQEVTKGAAITEVKFMAASGHYFPADYVSKMNLPAGLTAEIRENSWYLIISGTPTSDVTINLPAASVRPTITVSMPTPAAGNTPATASDITLTYSDINKSISKNLTISNVVWQSYVSNGDGSITPGNTLSSGDKFVEGTEYYVTIDFEGVSENYAIVPAADTTAWRNAEWGSRTMTLYFNVTGAPCNHEYTNDWLANGNTHWHECKLCRAHAGEVAHTFGDWITDTPATDTTDGSKHRTCSVCQYQENATIPKTGTGEIVPPTPDNPGTIVIIRPAEEEKPAQQPNPSTGANDLVGLAVAAAVAAALGSAALLRKHD